MVKGILIDYGGTIDTNGVHWGEVLWNSYGLYDVPVTKEQFRQAYTYAEKALALKPLIHPEHDFLQVLTIKLEQQFSFLSENNFLPEQYSKAAPISMIAAACNSFAATCISEAKPVLVKMSAKYPVVMVSNFYGNIKAVLAGFGILDLFEEIIESSVVKYRKPDPQIYQLGVAALALPAAECVVIGDSYVKDIMPGKLAGCQTIWLKGEGWETDPVNPVAADTTIRDFKTLQAILSL